jgi:hypothetical protein
MRNQASNCRTAGTIVAQDLPKKTHSLTSGVLIRSSKRIQPLAVLAIDETL